MFLFLRDFDLYYWTAMRNLSYPILSSKLRPEHINLVYPSIIHAILMPTLVIYLWHDFALLRHGYHWLTSFLILAKFQSTPRDVLWCSAAPYSLRIKLLIHGRMDFHEHWINPKDLFRNQNAAISTTVAIHKKLSSVDSIATNSRVKTRRDI